MVNVSYSCGEPIGVLNSNSRMPRDVICHDAVSKLASFESQNMFFKSKNMGVISDIAVIPDYTMP